MSAMPEGIKLVEAVDKWRARMVRTTTKGVEKTRRGWMRGERVLSDSEVTTHDELGYIVRNIHTAGFPRPTADRRGVTFSVLAGGDRYTITLAWSEGEFTYMHHEPG